MININGRVCGVINSMEFFVDDNLDECLIYGLKKY